MTRLKGKHCFTTAAGAGIGRATALRLREEGASVVATDIDEAALARLAAEAPGIETRRLDVTEAAAIRALVEAAGPFDVLVNCAGYVHSGSVLDCTDADWDFAFALNARSMFSTMKAVIPGMLAKGGGSIINIASVAGAVMGLPDRFIYSATKAAVAGMTKSVAADYVKQGIRCNAICPGTVESPSLEARMRAQGDYEATRAAFIARQPMGRLGRPEEIAAFVAYLASDEAAFTTGQWHVIDGGMDI
ncbi:MAG TPA: SDR family oxidoreductase [Paracoccaceae bacterium]|nr:SDR family oxidoreductase [Paracoccaceae bacterium]